MRTPAHRNTAGFSGSLRTTSGSRTVTLREVAAFPRHTSADHEHCAATLELLSRIGAVPGQQVRITAAGTTALFTFVAPMLHDHLDQVHLTAEGLRRLGCPESAEALIDIQVVRDCVDEVDARNRSEFIEQLVDPTAHKNLIAIAPHGGAMEKHTDHQADYLARVLGHDRASAWMCKGWHRGGGAFMKWHITSQDISERSFPLLRKVRHRHFQHAVAFHGYQGDDILIGGGADLSMKIGLQQALSRALSGSEVNVRTVPRGEQYDGRESANLVNRMTIGNNGIQLEQGRRVRKHHWQVVAEAVSRFYRELILP